jgi:hypothetical protein
MVLQMKTLKILPILAGVFIILYSSIAYDYKTQVKGTKYKCAMGYCYVYVFVNVEWTDDMNRAWFQGIVPVVCNIELKINDENGDSSIEEGVQQKYIKIPRGYGSDYFEFISDVGSRRIKNIELIDCNCKTQFEK